MRFRRRRVRGGRLGTRRGTMSGKNSCLRIGLRRRRILRLKLLAGLIVD